MANPIRRVLFHPANFGVSANGAKLVHKGSLPLRAVTSMDALKREIAATTTNVGNMVHNEAVAKSFTVQLGRSCLSSIEHLYFRECKGNTQDFRQLMLDNFDAVVLSYANLISPPLPGRADAQQAHMERLCEIVKALPVPLFIFGMGMQKAVSGPDELVPGMVEFLKLAGEKARIFAVRGAETEAFLHSIGVPQAVALGCPSLYVYPENILSIKPHAPTGSDRVLTAGYMGLRHLRGHESERVDFLRNLSHTFTANYVFQNDFYSYHELGDLDGFYDDASGLCDKMVVDAYVRACGKNRLRFQNYWHFRDARSWRQLAAEHDFFFGDRFHGGVVSLQVGKPALFVYKDLRVRELTNHFGIPNVALGAITADNLLDLAGEAFSAERTEKFQETYRSRLREYHERCRDAGLEPVAKMSTAATKAAPVQRSWKEDVVRLAMEGERPAAPRKDKRSLWKRLRGKPVAAVGRPRFGSAVGAAVAIFERDGAGLKSLELVVRTLLDANRSETAAACVAHVFEAAGEEMATLDSDAVFRLGNLLHSASQNDAARRCLELLYDVRRERSERNLRLYANILLALDKFERAYALLDRFKRKRGSSAATEFLQARAALNIGRLDDADQHAALALEHEPDEHLKRRIIALRSRAEAEFSPEN